MRGLHERIQLKARAAPAVDRPRRRIVGKTTPSLYPSLLADKCGCVDATRLAMITLPNERIGGAECMVSRGPQQLVMWIEPPATRPMAMVGGPAAAQAQPSRKYLSTNDVGHVKVSAVPMLLGWVVLPKVSRPRSSRAAQ